MYELSKKKDLLIYENDLFFSIFEPHPNDLGDVIIGFKLQNNAHLATREDLFKMLNQPYSYYQSDGKDILLKQELDAFKHTYRNLTKTNLVKVYSKLIKLKIDATSVNDSEEMLEELEKCSKIKGYGYSIVDLLTKQYTPEHPEYYQYNHLHWNLFLKMARPINPDDNFRNNRTYRHIHPNILRIPPKVEKIIQKTS